MKDFSLIVPFYRNVAMLRRQCEEWNHYPPAAKIIVVDDGSPEPALPVILECLIPERRNVLTLYCIHHDIPWNREGARNLGAHLAGTDWIVHVDIDHVMSAPAASALLGIDPDPARWYRFRRFRCGRADATRRKDAIADDAAYGEIKPHVDSYLITRDLYWKAGGYNEDFAGCLGGGGEFLRRLGRCAPGDQLPPIVALNVYTRDLIPDASDLTLSRDSSEGKRRERAINASGDSMPKNHMRFKWSRQL